MPVHVNNLQEKVQVSDKLLDLVNRAVYEVLLNEGWDAKVAEVGVVLVDDEKIRDFNKQYRNVDRSTDVLSFALQEGAPMPGGEALLGDVLISLETALRQAVEYGHSVERELAYLIVHGVLHLLGYDHTAEEERKLMRAKEELVLNRLGVAR